MVLIDGEHDDRDNRTGQREQSIQDHHGYDQFGEAFVGVTCQSESVREGKDDRCNYPENEIIASCHQHQSPDRAILLSFGVICRWNGERDEQVDHSGSE